MSVKSSAHYQREYRKRLRDQGLVKKEVWIRPEYAQELARLEKMLRQEGALIKAKGVASMSDNTNVWTTSSLYAALVEDDLFESGRAAIEFIDGVEPTLHVVMAEYGDLPLFLSVSGEQVIVESVLWSVDAIADVAAFNDAILRTHKYFPLSTISLDRIAGQGDFYHMFGALSADSSLANVLLEIEVLASNVLQATEAYLEFLSVSADAV